MKKVIVFLLSAFLSFSFIPNDLKATNNLTATELPSDSSTAKINSRLEEINKMDKSTLTHSEKRALNKEVRSMEKTIHKKDGGVVIYMSAGLLLILIIILLIILI